MTNYHDYRNELKNASEADVARVAKEIESMRYQRRVQETLRNARETAGLSQQELADRVGVARSRISEWELGVRTPALESIIKIAQAAGLKACDLVAQIEKENAEMKPELIYAVSARYTQPGREKVEDIINFDGPYDFNVAITEAQLTAHNADFIIRSGNAQGRRITGLEIIIEQYVKSEYDLAADEAEDLPFDPPMMAVTYTKMDGGLALTDVKIFGDFNLQGQKMKDVEEALMA